MPNQDAFFLIAPEFIEGDNVQNAHVFDGYYNSDTQKWRVDKTESRCGNMQAKKIERALLKETNANTFCHKVVDGHDLSFNACGRCMASFFADEDD